MKHSAPEKNIKVEFEFKAILVWAILLILWIEWATLVTHHLFMAHIFDQNAGIKHSLCSFTYWHFICLMT